MDVIAGKAGSFFVVTGNVDRATVGKLAKISFDEFSRYNAWSTMKRFSKQTDWEYASQNSLDIEILNNFASFTKFVDLKATQDLAFFIEMEIGREQLEDDLEIRVVNPNNFKNGFAYTAPREVAGLLTDPVVLKDEDIPQLLKKTGISIKRTILSNFVKWNNVTYRVDVVPADRENKKITARGSEISIGEYCYVFNSDDWIYIKNIDKALKRNSGGQNKFLFWKNKTEEEFFEDVVKKVCKEKKNQIMYAALYKKYVELQGRRADYRSILVHEYHHVKNRILIENRCLKPNAKALQAADFYYLLVEDERSAHLAVTLDRIERYWHDRDWDSLARKEQCFAFLASRSEAERDKLLCNLDFVINTKLKHWTYYSLDAHYQKLAQRLPWLLKYSSVAKGIDERRKEYVLMRSMLYSFRLYNPFTKRYKFVCLDKYIKVNIPVSGQAMSNIIGKAQMFIDRKSNAKEMLKIKYGITDRMIKVAANIYDDNLRIKKISG